MDSTKFKIMAVAAVLLPPRLLNQNPRKRLAALYLTVLEGF
jgi:hypothetical protein